MTGAPRPLVLLWVAQTLSLIGTDLTRFAISVWAYSHSQESVSDYAWVTVCREGPALMLAPVTGLLVDRVGGTRTGRRALLLGADFTSLASSMWLFHLYILGDLTVRNVYVAGAVQSIANSVQWPAFMALMTRLTPPAELVRLGAVNEAIPALVMLVAPSVAGVVLASTSNDLTPLFYIELVTCLIGSIVLCTVWLPPDEETDESINGINTGTAATSTSSEVHVGSCSKSQPSSFATEHNTAVASPTDGLRSITADVIEPIGFLVTRPSLLALMAFTGACNFANGMVQVLFTPLIMAFSTTSALAAVLTLSGTGAIAGSIFLGKFAPVRPVRAMLLCSAAQGVLLALVGTYPSSALILTVAFLYMALIPAVRVCRQAIFQRETPVGLQGRIFALQRAMREGCVPLAGLASGPVADRLEVLMAHNHSSRLAEACGPFIGVGKGRGVALLFVLVGGVYSLLSVCALRSTTLCRLDDTVAPQSADTTKKVKSS